MLEKIQYLGKATCRGILFLIIVLLPATYLSLSCQKAGRRYLFTEISKEARLEFVHDAGNHGQYELPENMVSGGGFLDYDNDGRLDIYLLNGASQKGSAVAANRLFRQTERGAFVDVTDATGAGDTGHGMGLAAGDIDNDGDVDLYVSNYGPDVLYRNNGEGTFSNITNAAGIENREWGASAVFHDFDLDGFLYLYIPNYVKYDSTVVCKDMAGRRDYCGVSRFPGVQDKIYQNNRDGTFSDYSQHSGIGAIAAKGLGVVSADFNNDGLADIYVANDEEPNNLWINKGDFRFEDLAMQYGVAVNAVGHPEAGMGIAVGFLDNLTTPDLFVTHLSEESNTYYKSTNGNTFFDNTSPAKLDAPSLPFTGFGAGFFDYDHDGDLDLAVVNGRIARPSSSASNASSAFWDQYAEPNLLFENKSDGAFAQVDADCGPFCRTIETSRGLAFGDVDNDGDLDLLVTNIGAPARLYRNDAVKSGNWLIVRVVDPALHRDTIGAEVTVYAESNVFKRLVLAGYSYLASHDVRVHFGLGKAETVDRIVVEWPGGKSEVFYGIAVNQFAVLEKGFGSALDD
ncbi:MAG: CRTAC1 family protein [bacterium]